MRPVRAKVEARTTGVELQADRALARLGRFIVTINRAAKHRADFQISSPLEPRRRRRGETRRGRGTHLNFPGKDVHRVHFNPPGTPRRNMADGEGERPRPR